MPAKPHHLLLIPFIAALASCSGISTHHLSARKAYNELKRTTGEISQPKDSAAEKLIEKASKESAHNPSLACDLYLEAAELTHKDITKSSTAALLYRHATGQAVALLNPAKSFLKRQAEPKRYIVSYARGQGLVDPTKFDSILFSDAVRVDHMENNQQHGIGAPVTCLMNYSPKNHKAHPFMHKIGISEPATAILDFPEEGRARISLHDSRKKSNAIQQSSTQTLAYNITVPLAEAFSRQRKKNIGLMGVLKPAAFIDQMAIYSIERIDPDKIPVVLIHGLKSKPATWLETYSSLMSENFFRENYQIYTFYYPSGLPPIYPAAGLRRELFRLHGELKARGARAQADKMILIGHSMGGLMTSFKIRDFRGMSEKLFTKPIKDLPIDVETQNALRAVLENPPPSFVKRAVFIATPHRGSQIANNWIGRIGSKLSKVPEQLLTLQLPAAARSMTSLGQTIVMADDELDGIVRLKAGDPMLDLTLAQPIIKGLSYHSIIGDRGKGGGLNKGDDPERSDGLVPYWSSRLDGASSEKIVPSGHSAHVDPEAIAELKRILRLHMAR